MKTKGFSKNIVALCDKMDSKYLELLHDISQYLYGEEYSMLKNYTIVSKDYKFKKKFIDRIDIENHVRNQSVHSSLELV